jgi:hypothetical protein
VAILKTNVISRAWKYICVYGPLFSIAIEIISLADMTILHVLIGVMWGWTTDPEEIAAQEAL